MHNLIYLLVKYGGLISFIVLEIICFTIIVNNNNKQEAIYSSTTQRLTGSFYHNIDQWTRFWKMSEVADSLADVNALLRAELKNARFVNTILKDSTFTADSVQHYTYTAARVTRNSVKNAHNYIRVNRGEEHDVTPHKGVIGVGKEGGIVGIVVATSRYYSKVMSLLNRNTHVSVEIKKNKEFGSLVWEGFDTKRFQMKDVPKYVQVAVGDTIQTSGFSDLFPKGIVVGTVDSIWLEPGSNIHGIGVELVNDLRQLEYVYIVNNLMEKDISKLEASSLQDE